MQGPFLKYFQKEDTEMNNKLVDMKLRFTNRDSFKRHIFNTHRGNMLSLEPKQSEDINYNGESNPEDVVKYYDRFSKFLDVIRLDKVEDDKSIEEDIEQPLEPQDEEENDEQIEGDIDSEDEIDEIDETEDEEDSEEDDSEDTPEFTREELEGYKYQKLVKLAKQNGIESKKKDEIIDALLGE